MGLYQKIYEVMNETEGLEKNLQVGFGKNAYNAVGEAEVLNMLKPLFKKYKLIIYPVSGEMTETNSSWETEDNGKKETKARNVTQLKVNFKIVDVESGESEVITGFGNGADSQDKGSGKAFTYAFKTALSKTFMLFSGEDSDNDHSDDIGAGSKSSKPNNQPQQKEQPKNNPTQPSDLEKRAATIYYHYTGNKPGQMGWTREQYNTFLNGLHSNGHISNVFGKKWTQKDIEYIESVIKESQK